MADWFGSRRNVKWTYKRVDWKTWDEVGDYNGIVGGSDEESFFTSIKGGGSLDYVGESLSSVDLVRTYYEFDGDDGEHVRVPVCTMLVDSDNETIDGSGAISGTVSTYSVLRVPDQRKPGLPMTVNANTKAVEAADKILRDLGLRTSMTDSGYTLASDHTFKPDDSYLDIVNWLLTTAGYMSASPDAYGVVILAPYENTKREPVFTFRDDHRSIMYPQVEDENNYSSTPNVVRLYAEDEYAGYYAVARNEDVDSPSSLPNRGGRETTLYEEINELKPPYNAGDSNQSAQADKRLDALKEMARQKLLNNTAEIEYVTISNGYYPLTQGDSVEIVYKDRRWVGTVTNIKRDHNTESKCSTKIRRFSSSSFEPTVEGGKIR